MFNLLGPALMYGAGIILAGSLILGAWATRPRKRRDE